MTQCTNEEGRQETTLSDADLHNGIFQNIVRETLERMQRMQRRRRMCPIRCSASYRSIARCADLETDLSGYGMM